MNYENSKTSDSHRLILDVNDKINVERNDKHVYHQKHETVAVNPPIRKYGEKANKLTNKKRRITFKTKSKYFIQGGLLWGCSKMKEERGGKNAPPPSLPNICYTYPKMMKIILMVQLYLL